MGRGKEGGVFPYLRIESKIKRDVRGQRRPHSHVEAPKIPPKDCCVVCCINSADEITLGRLIIFEISGNKARSVQH